MVETGIIETPKTSRMQTGCSATWAISPLTGQCGWIWTSESSVSKTDGNGQTSPHTVILFWWGGCDSNTLSKKRQIYSLLQLSNSGAPSNFSQKPLAQSTVIQRILQKVSLTGVVTFPHHHPTKQSRTESPIWQLLLGDLYLTQPRIGVQ